MEPAREYFYDKLKKEWAAEQEKKEAAEKARLAAAEAAKVPSVTYFAIAGSQHIESETHQCLETRKGGTLVARAQGPQGKWQGQQLLSLWR